VHVSPTGALEPCPFAPYSDVNLKTVPLKEALGSRFLAAMRENHDAFENPSGACALWSNREQPRREGSAPRHRRVAKQGVARELEEDETVSGTSPKTFMPGEKAGGKA
jgi:hypothetical protein